MSRKSARANTSSPAAAAPRAHHLSSLLMACAAIALIQALHVNQGNYAPFALVLLGVSLLACAGAVVLPKLGVLAPPSMEAAALLLLGAGLVLESAQLIAQALPTTNLTFQTVEQLRPFTMGAVAMAALASASLGVKPWTGRLGLPAAIVIFLGLCLWLLRNTDPGIDVYMFHDVGLHALATGHNPYASVYPDVYGPQSGFYGPGMSVNGKLTFGFPYPPFSLLLTFFAYELGDPRYAMVLAYVGVPVLLLVLRRGRLSVGAAALLLLVPTVFFVLTNAWTEPLILFFMVATVLVAERYPKALPIVAGLWLASKQYLVLLAPALLLLQPPGWPLRRKARFFLIAAGVALAITLPFAAWDFGAFWRSVVATQFLQPFRPDSLSFLVPFAGAQPPSSLWGFVAYGLALAVALWRPVRGAQGFASAVALMAICFFAFNKQAFVNYFTFCLGAMCLALALSPTGDLTARDPRAGTQGV